MAGEACLAALSQWHVFPQKFGCAGYGNPLTLVCTNVEGSTELWEKAQHEMLLVSAWHCLCGAPSQSKLPDHQLGTASSWCASLSYFPA